MGISLLITYVDIWGLQSYKPEETRCRRGDSVLVSWSYFLITQKTRYKDHQVNEFLPQPHNPQAMAKFECVCDSHLYSRIESNVTIQ